MSSDNQLLRHAARIRAAVLQLRQLPVDRRRQYYDQLAAEMRALLDFIQSHTWTAEEAAARPPVLVSAMREIQAAWARNKDVWDIDVSAIDVGGQEVPFEGTLGPDCWWEQIGEGGADQEAASARDAVARATGQSDTADARRDIIIDPLSHPPAVQDSGDLDQLHADAASLAPYPRSPSASNIRKARRLRKSTAPPIDAIAGATNPVPCVKCSKAGWTCYAGQFAACTSCAQRKVMCSLVGCVEGADDTKPRRRVKKRASVDAWAENDLPPAKKAKTNGYSVFSHPTLIGDGGSVQGEQRRVSLREPPPSNTVLGTQNGATRDHTHPSPPPAIAAFTPSPRERNTAAYAERTSPAAPAQDVPRPSESTRNRSPPAQTPREWLDSWDDPPYPFSAFKLKAEFARNPPSREIPAQHPPPRDPSGPLHPPPAPAPATSTEGATSAIVEELRRFRQTFESKMFDMAMLTSDTNRALVGLTQEIKKWREGGRTL